MLNLRCTSYCHNISILTYAYYTSIEIPCTVHHRNDLEGGFQSSATLAHAIIASFTFLALSAWMIVYGTRLYKNVFQTRGSEGGQQRVYKQNLDPGAQRERSRTISRLLTVLFVFSVCYLIRGICVSLIAYDLITDHDVLSRQFTLLGWFLCSQWIPFGISVSHSYVINMSMICPNPISHFNMCVFRYLCDPLQASLMLYVAMPAPSSKQRPPKPGEVRHMGVTELYAMTADSTGSGVTPRPPESSSSSSAAPSDGLTTMNPCLSTSKCCY